jgi:capsular polysaccharide biosynthesis protein
MELRDMIDIFRRHAKYFWMIVFVCIVIGMAWQHFFQKNNVVSDLTLNIARSGSAHTDAYQYDDFYRLQADERFADTVVRWLASPRMATDIYENIHIDTSSLSSRDLTHSFAAERLSSQMIRVTYSAENEQVAKKLSQSIISNLNRESMDLNKSQQDQTWFLIVGDDPVVRDGRLSVLFVMGISIALGIFIGFWMVLLRHYREGGQKRMMRRSQ